MMKPEKGTGQIASEVALLPHQCGVPASVGTVHLCGSEGFDRAARENWPLISSVGIGIWIRRASFAVVLVAMLTSSELQAASEARLSEGSNRHTVELKNYKRGLFWGSCGPSMHSMQWEYTFTLTGPGPDFKSENIAVKDGSLKDVPISGGTIALDTKQHTINIDLKITAGTAEISFPHNGRYKLKNYPAGRSH